MAKGELKMGTWTWRTGDGRVESWPCGCRGHGHTDPSMVNYLLPFLLHPSPYPPLPSPLFPSAPLFTLPSHVCFPSSSNSCPSVNVSPPPPTSCSHLTSLVSSLPLPPPSLSVRDHHSFLTSAQGIHHCWAVNRQSACHHHLPELWPVLVSNLDPSRLLLSAT